MRLYNSVFVDVKRINIKELQVDHHLLHDSA